MSRQEKLPVEGIFIRNPTGISQRHKSPQTSMDQRDITSIWQKGESEFTLSSMNFIQAGVEHIVQFKSS